MNLQHREYNDSHYQHTLSDTLTFVGRGLHSDIQVVMRMLPAEPNSGIVFARRDVAPYRSEIPALWHNVIDTRLSTTLGNALGVRVSTVEHLLAALYACGVDNARIVLDGPEVPIMDGSALPFVSVIRQTGTVKQSALRRAFLIKTPISIYDEDRYACLMPSPVPWICLEIDFDSDAIGKQEISLPINEKTFHDELAPARTFGFEEQIHTLRSLGLAKGGSLRNAVLVRDNEVLNDGGLRYRDEFVRHKALDCIGDMALAGARIVGQFTGYRTGHQINNDLLRQLMLCDDCWEFTSLAEAQAYWKTFRGMTGANPDVEILKIAEE